MNDTACQLAQNATEPQDGLLVVLACNKRTLSGILNVTRDYPLESAEILFGYLMPILLLLTLLTNTLVIIVLAQKHMRTPTNIVLFTMAIADLFTLIPPAPWYIYLFTLGHHDKHLYPPQYCYAYHYMTDVLPIYFHTASIWLALLLAGQRYVYVCHPNLAKTWCTVGHVKMAVVLVFVVDLIHQSPKLLDNRFISVYVETEDRRLHRACKNVLAEWAQNRVALYLPIYYIFRILFVYLLPCSLLIYINLVLLFTLRRATCRRTQLKSGNYGAAAAGGPTAGAGAATATSEIGPQKALKSSRARESANTSFGASLQQPAIQADCSNNNSETNKSKTTANTTLNTLSTPQRDQDDRHRFTFAPDRARQLGAFADSDPEEGGGAPPAVAAASLRLSAESNACTCSTSATNSISQVACQATHPAVRCNLSSGAGRRRYLGGARDDDAGSCPECMVCERAAELEESCKHCLCHHQHQHQQHHHLFSSTRCPTGKLCVLPSDLSQCSTRDSAGWLAPETECDCRQPSKALQTDPSLDGIAGAADLLLEERAPLAKSSSAVWRRSAAAYQQHTGSLQVCCCPPGARSQQQQCCCLQAARGRSFEPLPEVSQTQSSSATTTEAGHQQQQRAATKRARIAATPRADASNNLLLVEPSEALLTQDEESTVPVVVEARGGGGRAQELVRAVRRTSRLAHLGDLLRSARDNIRSSILAAASSTEGGRCATSGQMPAAGVGASSQQQSRTIDSNRTTLMLIVVVFVFLFVEVPVAAATIVHVLLNLLKEEHEEVDYTVINNIKLIGNFLIILSYSINFTIYCSMSKKFRDTFKELFLWRSRGDTCDTITPAPGPPTTRHTQPAPHNRHSTFNYFASKADIQLCSKSQAPAVAAAATSSTTQRNPNHSLTCSGGGQTAPRKDPV